MRLLFSLLVFLFMLPAARAQDSVNLSSIRIGPYKIGMSKAEAERTAGVKLRLGTEANQYNDTNVVMYGGQRVYIALATYGDQSAQDNRIVRLWTRSPKFRTKSGLGVGSTRRQLLDAYGSYPSFSVYPEYEENGKPSKDKSHFQLSDTDAGTYIDFYLINGTVWEVRIYIDEGGC